MLSTKGGDAVRAYVWTVGDSAPVMANEREVDIWVANVELRPHFQPIAWSDDSTLIVPLLPRGSDPRFDPIGEAERRATRGWAIVRSGGLQSTASVLDSYPDSLPDYLSTEDIVAINIPRGSSTVLATVPRDPTTSGQRGLVLSPAGQTAAIITSRLEPPVATERLTRTMARYHVGLVDIAHRTGVRWVGAFVGDNTSMERPPLVRWAPDGHALALVGRRAGAASDSSCAFVVDAGNAQITATFPTESPRPAAILAPSRPRQCLDAAWVAADTLRIQAVSDRGEPGWWTVPELAPATARTAKVPGTNDLNLLEHTLHGGTVRIVWPRTRYGTSSAPLVVVDHHTRTGDTLYAATRMAGSLRLERIGPLREGWSVEAYDPRLRTAIVVQRHRAVAALSATGEHVLLRVNSWAARFAQPRKLRIRYLSERGDSLDAIVVLPTPYTPGRRYPVVAWVYAGTVYADTSDVHVDTFTPSPLNLMPLAASGYVILFPSMPLASEQGDGGHVLPQLTNGVLPAVNRLAELGIADPDRVAVMGQSFGGYSTLGLVTQTQQFRTAIALAVLSDEVSWYGKLRPWDRYNNDAQVMLANPKMAEAGQLRLGASPWTNLWRYLVNSPLFYADRVQTPVMIMQGDMDFVGPEQAEEFFTALYRMGKRAQLVRYVGEGHVIESPANVRDMWSRIEAWLTQTMGANALAARPRDR